MRKLWTFTPAYAVKELNHGWTRINTDENRLARFRHG